MPEGHHTNWQSLQRTKTGVVQFSSKLQGLLHWAHLHSQKPTSELGDLQCKSHLCHIHWIHTHPSDLSFTFRWVVWPTGINTRSPGGAATDGCPFCLLTTLLYFSPCIPTWQFCSLWLMDQLSFSTSLSCFTSFFLVFTLHLSPFKSATQLIL